jgi:hypothetical protein
MNRILILLAFMFASLALLSQSYEPFFSDTNQFNIVHHITCKNNLVNDAFAPCIVTNEYFIIKTNQLIFNEKNYFVAQNKQGVLLTPENIILEGLLIREDSTGKIFHYFQ